MKTIKVFEAFAGVGAQAMALHTAVIEMINEENPNEHDAGRNG